MLINARYPGRCRRCGERFPAGARIEWTKRNGARHAVDDRRPPGRFGTGCLGSPHVEPAPEEPTVNETAGYVAGALAEDWLVDDGGEGVDWLAPVTVRRGVGALPVW